jgi:hypothetical protein
MHKVLRYFDKLEDRIRGRLSQYPIVYSIIGGTAIVLFWRGVWITADELAMNIPPEYGWIDGPVSLITSILILLATGLFVSFFISDNVILSGLRKEKKLVEKTEAEVRKEGSILTDLDATVHTIDEEIKRIEQKKINK